MGAAKENVSNGRGQILDTLWFGSIGSGVLTASVCAHLSPSFPSFLFPSFLCRLSRGEGRVLCGRYLGWIGAERACTKKSGRTGASWQVSLTNTAWCLNPLWVCQRQQAGWLSVTFQLPPEPEAQWPSDSLSGSLPFLYPLLFFCFPFPQPNPDLRPPTCCIPNVQSSFLLSASFLHRKFF